MDDVVGGSVFLFYLTKVGVSFCTLDDLWFALVVPVRINLIEYYCISFSAHWLNVP